MLDLKPGPGIGPLIVGGNISPTRIKIIPQTHPLQAVFIKVDPRQSVEEMVDLGEYDEIDPFILSGEPCPGTDECGAYLARLLRVSRKTPAGALRTNIEKMGLTLGKFRAGLAYGAATIARRNLERIAFLGEFFYHREFFDFGCIEIGHNGRRCLNLTHRREMLDPSWCILVLKKIGPS